MFLLGLIVIQVQSRRGQVPGFAVEALLWIQACDKSVCERKVSLMFRYQSRRTN